MFVFVGHLITQECILYTEFKLIIQHLPDSAVTLYIIGYIQGISRAAGSLTSAATGIRFFRLRHNPLRNGFSFFTGNLISYDVFTPFNIQHHRTGLKVFMCDRQTILRRIRQRTYDLALTVRYGTPFTAVFGQFPEHHRIVADIIHMVDQPSFITVPHHKCTDLIELTAFPVGDLPLQAAFIYHIFTIDISPLLPLFISETQTIITIDHLPGQIGDHHFPYFVQYIAANDCINIRHGLI